METPCPLSFVPFFTVVFTRKRLVVFKTDFLVSEFKMVYSQILLPSWSSKIETKTAPLRDVSFIKSEIGTVKLPTSLASDGTSGLETGWMPTVKSHVVDAVWPFESVRLTETEWVPMARRLF